MSGYWYKLVGITNGVDVSVFDPSTDKALVQNYSIRDFAAGKAANKAAMQRELGLPERPEVPVLAMITRLASHKGIDLLCYIARRLLGMDVQLVILGTGEDARLRRGRWSAPGLFSSACRCLVGNEADRQVSRNRKTLE